MKTPFENRTIILGVTGSIAAYKASELASRLAQSGANVDVILTQSALQFITPLTFQSVTGRRAYSDADLWSDQGHVLHISLGKDADLLVIAPVSANTLAKLAHGLADNLLTVTALAARGPLLVAPAMDGGMFSHAATQANLETLRQRGVRILGPAEGHLASGMVGPGRMLEPSELQGHIRLALASDGPLAGKKVVVTAGGTQEPIDPVRVIANRSSGKQGFALAQAALDLGAEVVLISGPVHLATPVGAQRVEVETTEQMQTAVMANIPQAEALLMAAAPADFRPTNPSGQKIKRKAGVPPVQLEPNPDILKAVAGYRAKNGWPRVSVGFAAESQNLLEDARHKLEGKRLDMIAANDIGASDAGFNVDTNRVTLLYAQPVNGSHEEALPLMSKDEVAQIVMERVTTLLKAV
ncbi:MAG: bifunctional phosphopantothenoylcysteine decarboxylase/phosphopantothenate--cysteine ligase CoaBC [Anaerolineales bacterium]